MIQSPYVRGYDEPNPAETIAQLHKLVDGLKLYIRHLEEKLETSRRETELLLAEDDTVLHLHVK